MTTANTIEAHGLRKHYGETTALDGVDLAVPARSVCALLGPNGAGKTTAVRILTTLSKADGGSATVAGFDVATEPGQVLSGVLRVGDGRGSVLVGGWVTSCRQAASRSFVDGPARLAFLLWPPFATDSASRAGS